MCAVPPGSFTGRRSGLCVQLLGKKPSIKMRQIAFRAIEVHSKVLHRAGDVCLIYAGRLQLR